MSGYKYSWPSDYLDPVPPTAIKKWGWRGLLGTDNCLWGGQEGRLGRSQRFRTRGTSKEVCVLLACGHCGGDGLEVQEEMQSALYRNKCVPQSHIHTHEQPSLTQPRRPALPQFSRETRLPTHTGTSSLAASQCCLECGGSVMSHVSEESLVKIKFDHVT